MGFLLCVELGVLGNANVRYDAGCSVCVLVIMIITLDRSKHPPIVRNFYKDYNAKTLLLGEVVPIYLT